MLFCKLFTGKNTCKNMYSILSFFSVSYYYSSYFYSVLMCLLLECVFCTTQNRNKLELNSRLTGLPQPAGLKFKSVQETSVLVSWDTLKFPFDGWELIFRNTVSVSFPISEQSQYMKFWNIYYLLNFAWGLIWS